MGRLENKLLILLVLLIAVPISVAFLRSQTLFDRSLAVGLNPGVTEALDDAVEVFGAYVRAEKARQEAVARGLADSRTLADRAAEGPAALRTFLLEYARAPRVQRIELVAAGGPPLVVDSPAFGDPAGWRLRTAEVPLDGVPGYTALRFAYGLEAAFLERFENMEAEVIAPRATLETYRENLAWEFALRFLLPLAGAVLVAGIISVVVGRRITRRLRDLRGAMEQVAAGDLDARVTPTGRDEVADLARGFNDMARRLAESRTRIEHLTRVSAFQGIARRLAHEIKNPLTPILLAVQQIHRSYKGDDARYRRTLDTAHEVVVDEVATLERLVTNFSRFAKLPTAERVDEDLAALARDLVAAHPEIEGLRAETPDDPVVAPVDKGLLRQALTNLVKNAGEALRDVDRPPRVTLRVESVDDVARLIVEDNGPGIPRDERERVFEPYVTGKDDGTGLGLAIVKKIVLDHDGTIAVADSADGGARFEIVLPRQLGPPT